MQQKRATKWNRMPLLACSSMVMATASMTGLERNADATVISGIVTGGSVQSNGGVFAKLTPPLTNPHGLPNSVGDDTFQDNNLYAFDEGQNIFVPTAIAVDDLFGPNGAGQVPANSIVASHYVFFDPDSLQTVTGTVTFDSDIYGVIFTTSNLADSDFLINTGVNYLNPGLRGLELSDDSVTILDSRTIHIDWEAGTPGDYIRVLTDFSPGAVPEPMTAVVLVLGGLAVFGGRVRRQTDQ